MILYRPRTCSLLLSLVLVLSACGEGSGDKGSVPYETLSEYGFFRAPIAEFQPVDGVIPYEVVIPSWADHTGKTRFMMLPPGEHVSVAGDEEWTFP